MVSRSLKLTTEVVMVSLSSPLLIISSFVDIFKEKPIKSWAGFKEKLSVVT